MKKSLAKAGFFSYHAEINAMRKVGFCKRILKGATLYVVRINTNGELVMSKPCERCEKICKKYGVKVYYSS